MLLSTKSAKTRGKTEKQNKKFHPVSPVQLLRPSIYGSKLFVFVCFPEGFCHFVSPTMMMLGLRKCSSWQTSAQRLHPSTFYPIGSMYGIFTYIWVIFRAHVGKYSIHGASGYIDVFIELLILATGPSKKTYSKNSQRALLPTSSGTPLDWYISGMLRFWFLIFKGLARILQTWNH